MTTEETKREFDPLDELEQTREIYIRFKSKALRRLVELDKLPNSGKDARELTSITGELEKAFNTWTLQEAKLGKHSSAIRGVLQGGALNLDAARTEVLERIARFRERS